MSFAAILANSIIYIFGFISLACCYQCFCKPISEEEGIPILIPNTSFTRPIFIDDDNTASNTTIYEPIPIPCTPEDELPKYDDVDGALPPPYPPQKQSDQYHFIQTLEPTN